MIHKEETFTGAQGTELFEQTWKPDGAIQAVMAIMHGLGEHGGRYQNVVDALVPKGYALGAFDLRGHGRSGGARGFIHQWADLIEDLNTFLTRMRQRFPGKPLFLYGHSFGGLIVLDYAIERPDGLQGLICSAPGLDTSGVSAVMLLLARLFSSILPSLQMATGLDATAISRDPAVVEAYVNDPLVHSKGTPRLAVESTAAIERVLGLPHRLTLPVLFLQGTSDRLVRPACVRDFFAQVASGDKTLREYAGGFHEPHNDLDYPNALADLEGWMQARI